MRVVIVGGVAGGATAAARMMRLDSFLDCTIVERSPDVSFANCGLPYYVGGEITNRKLLSLQTPRSLKKAIGVTNVLNLTEVTAVDRVKKIVHVKNLRDNSTSTLPYDKLLLSPGASPFIPPVPGVTDGRIFTLRNLVDVDRLKKAVGHKCHRAAIIGAGFIGLEMAEQLQHIGKEVTLIEQAPAVLPQADVELAHFLHGPIEAHGIRLITGNGLKAFHPHPDHLTVELHDGTMLDVETAMLCIGVRPDNKLAVDAKLALCPRGQIAVNDYMQTSDPDIYSVGDVVETKDMVFPDRRTWIALGNVANMQARIAADHMITGKSIPYAGSLGTSIVRVFDTTLALTGWTEKRLKAAQIPHRCRCITSLDHASYYPNATTITIKLIWCPETGRILGAQGVGQKGIDKRIDVFATAVQARMTIDDLTLSQLTYSPPFGSARDPVNVAALVARNDRDGLVISVAGVRDGRVLLDVRTPDEQSVDPIEGAVHTPWLDIRELVQEGKLDKTKKYTVLCNWGRAAYFATRVLMQHGYDVEKLDGGRMMMLQRERTESNKL